MNIMEAKSNVYNNKKSIIIFAFPAFANISYELYKKKISRAKPNSLQKFGTHVQTKPLLNRIQ